MNEDSSPLRPPRFPSDEAKCSPEFVEELGAHCTIVDSSDSARAEAGADWWPLGALWMLDGHDGEGCLPSVPEVVARPSTSQEVAEVLRLCGQRRVPVTAMGGRSGVCGGALSIHGGVALDLGGLVGINHVDVDSGIVDVQAGTFGNDFEAALRTNHQLTLGHWPQSMDISTVGGWLACRSAGQMSTRYGKIEDMVVGLEVALADGSIIRTGGTPRAAVGPDLSQLFIGSEGTLGIITSAMLRCHPLPAGSASAAYGFDDFLTGIETCRRILRRGATPAVLRLYDEHESLRSHQVSDRAVLLVLDEADPQIVAATMSIVEDECSSAAVLDPALVDRWMEHRNDVSALPALLTKGWVLDTMEISARWTILNELYEQVIASLHSLPGMQVASAHLSHSYLDGACLYITFAMRPIEGSGSREQCYLDAWDAATAVVQASGAAISHHHGIGLNRHRFMAHAHGTSAQVLDSLKLSLDPAGVLNPGKLGMTDRFGNLAWP